MRSIASTFPGRTLCVYLLAPLVPRGYLNPVELVRSAAHLRTAFDAAFADDAARSARGAGAEGADTDAGAEGGAEGASADTEQVYWMDSGAGAAGASRASRAAGASHASRASHASHASHDSHRPRAVHVHVEAGHTGLLMALAALYEGDRGRYMARLTLYLHPTNSDLETRKSVWMTSALRQLGGCLCTKTGATQRRTALAQQIVLRDCIAHKGDDAYTRAIAACDEVWAIGMGPEAVARAVGRSRKPVRRWTMDRGALATMASTPAPTAALPPPPPPPPSAAATESTSFKRVFESYVPSAAKAARTAPEPPGGGAATMDGL
jgi:hypothetical protein